jgi:hypothetical protein
MRAALVAVVLLAVTGCGTVARQAQQHRAVEIHWPPVAAGTRAQWYRGVEQAPPEPVTLTERELEDALAAAADEAGSTLVRTHYLPLLGGTAELVVQPSEPESASRKLTELLGPLGHENRPYFVTVVNGAGDALLVLGWTPHIEGAIGQGIAWEAPGFDSGVIVGKPVTLDDISGDPRLPAASLDQTSK